MSLYHFLPISFFQWSEHSYFASLIERSTWAFAVIETIHIVALAVLLGSTLLVDLRLLGRGMTQEPVAALSRTLLPWTWSMLVALFITGILMFGSEAVQLSDSGPFFYKMVILFLAVLFHATIHRKVTGSDAIEGTMSAKVAACLSLSCWLSVALAGRAIAFL